MTVKFLLFSPLSACAVASALFTVSAAVWAADHRDAPALSNIDSGQMERCAAPMAVPMRVSVKVPNEVLRHANISVDHYTRSADGLVDAADYILWNQAMGSTLAIIVNPGDDPGTGQVNEGFVTFPSMKRNAYTVKFRFESITSGQSCELAGRVDYGLPNAVVFNWSSGAIKHRQ